MSTKRQIEFPQISVGRADLEMHAHLRIVLLQYAIEISGERFPVSLQNYVARQQMKARGGRVVIDANDGRGFSWGSGGDKPRVHLLALAVLQCQSDVGERLLVRKLLGARNIARRKTHENRFR